MKRERKEWLSWKDLRELGANPDRPRRVIPPGGPQRVQVRRIRPAPASAPRGGGGHS